jgi:hypothetical protein
MKLKVTELLHCFLRADSNLQVHSLLSPAVLGWLIIKGPVLWLCLYRTGVRGVLLSRCLASDCIYMYRQPGILTRVAHMLPSIYVWIDRQTRRERPWWNPSFEIKTICVFLLFFDCVYLLYVISHRVLKSLAPLAKFSEKMTDLRKWPAKLEYHPSGIVL